MRALTVEPGVSDSAMVTDVTEPVPAADELLVEGLAVGVCGTDREIVAGAYGWPPPGRERLVLGHESLGRVRQAPPASGFAVGDLVVGVVRRPDPVPCGACAHGEFDMCRNGRYTERGIKEHDGYASELWTVEPQYAVRLDPALEHTGVLLEPTSVVAKAWEQVERIGARAWFAPRRVLVTGAGPIGLLAALLGLQRGLDVHVLDQMHGGRKPDAVAALGATYHSKPVADVAQALDPDVVIEATGVGSVVFDAIAHTGAYGITCLTGVSAAGRTIRVDAGATNRELVLENDVVVGSVNANQRHYVAAAQALADADPGWLDRLITRRVPLERYGEALTAERDDIKVVLTPN
jgi:threonine dehydrogenase-like Zn-dependent dehydrogenase